MTDFRWKEFTSGDTTYRLNMLIVVNGPLPSSNTAFFTAAGLFHMAELVEDGFTEKVMYHPLFIYIENYPDWLPCIVLCK